MIDALTHPAALGPLVAIAVFAGALFARLFDARLSLGMAAALALIAGGGVSVIAPSGASIGFVIWTVVMSFGLATLAISDALTESVADGVTIPMLILGVIHWSTLPTSFWPMAAGLGALFGVTLVIALVMRARWRASVGGGDVFLAGIAMAWLGPFAFVDVILIASFLILPQFAVRVFATPREEEGDVAAASSTTTPLAPALAIAQLFIWIYGPIL